MAVSKTLIILQQISYVFTAHVTLGLPALVFITFKSVQGEISLIQKWFHKIAIYYYPC